MKFLQTKKQVLLGVIAALGLLVLCLVVTAALFAGKGGTKLLDGVNPVQFIPGQQVTITGKFTKFNQEGCQAGQGVCSLMLQTNYFSEVEVLLTDACTFDTEITSRTPEEAMGHEFEVKGTLKSLTQLSPCGGYIKELF
jgi:hypothetical protein